MEFVTAFVALFTITNPVGNIPLFLALTTNQTPRQQRITARTAAFAVAVVLIICLFVGQAILHLFGIRMEAFTFAGSLVVATLAWSMLSIQTSGQRHTAQEGDEAASKASITVVPLAIPILAGPGAISTVISSATNSNLVEKAIGTTGYISRGSGRGSYPVTCGRDSKGLGRSRNERADSEYLG